jgi:hypothetical protein
LFDSLDQKQSSIAAGLRKRAGEIGAVWVRENQSSWIRKAINIEEVFFVEDFGVEVDLALPV